MKKLLKILFYLSLILVFTSNLLVSQKSTVDTLTFIKAQDLLNNSSSGYLAYKANYKTPDYDFHCYAKQYFIKNGNKITAMYIMQYEDNGIYEYVYYQDTLLTYAYISNEIITGKQYTLNPQTGSINKFRMLINKDILSTSPYKARYYDSIQSGKQLIVAEVDSTNIANKIGHSNKSLKIVLNKEDLTLNYYKTNTEYFSFGTIDDFSNTEYIIDSISLYPDTNKDVENFIKYKYHKLILLNLRRNADLDIIMKK